MPAGPVITHVAYAWGFEHYEASVRVADEPTLSEIVSAAERATAAARAANGERLEAPRLRCTGGHVRVVVAFSMLAES